MNTQKKLLDLLPTIPQYFKQYVDPKVNLDETPHIPCPFHGEISGKSFSYSADKGIWRCFGACHTGGTVVDLHKLNYKIKSKKEAVESICRLYDISTSKLPDFTKEVIEVDEKDVFRRRALATACNLAKNPDDWVELDYILSKYPYSITELKSYCFVRGVPLEVEE